MMITTLTGANSFSLGVFLRKKTEGFTARHGQFGLQRLDGQDNTYEQIVEAMTSLPFLASRKLVILRQPSTHKQFAEQIEELAGQVPETNDVVLLEPKLDKRLAYYKYLVKHTDFHDFPELDMNGLTSWLVGITKERAGSISSSDARYLVERTGLNQQMLVNEIDKLLLYNPQINQETINLLIEPTPQSTIFQLMEAAFAGNTKRAIDLYAEQRALKVEPPQIIALLAWQLHILAIIKTAGERSSDIIAREAKLNPYVVSKSQSIATKLSLNQLKQLLNDLINIDIKTKRSVIDTDEALQHFLIGLAKG